VKVSTDVCGQIVRAVIDGAIDTLDTHVTLVHLRALQEVARGYFSGEMIGVTEVAKNLDIPMSTASRLLAQLGDFEPDGFGFITQIRHPQDRRRVVLGLTDLGIRKRKQHLSYISDTISPLINELYEQ